MSLEPQNSHNLQLNIQKILCLDGPSALGECIVDGIVLGNFLRLTLLNINVIYLDRSSQAPNNHRDQVWARDPLRTTKKKVEIFDSRKFGISQ